MANKIKKTNQETTSYQSLNLPDIEETSDRLEAFNANVVLPIFIVLIAGFLVATMIKRINGFLSE